MNYTAQIILDTLLGLQPRRTAEAPQDARGVYGLVDHLGDVRYIGSTSSTSQTLYERIHQRHRTGSEGMSHYFSLMYNVGRMWRDRRDPTAGPDAAHAKALRNAFIAEHCAAVWVPVPDDLEIATLEHQILAIAPAHAIAWNGRAMAVYDEPVDLVDGTIARLGWGQDRIAAIERQRQRYSGFAPSSLPSSAISPAPPNFPSGDFRFFALDVETANYDRASICQIGVACVRPDKSIETWVTYVDPQTTDWSCSRIHGITARTVQGAPTFDQVFPMLKNALADQTVYQHSPFDQGAIAAACTRNGLTLPTWTWQDSVRVARRAWPELKGNGGHGLASLKNHLGLNFSHHDAGEDARASAEVVLHAEAHMIASAPRIERAARIAKPPARILRELLAASAAISPSEPKLPPITSTVRHLGTSEITQGNIDHNHIYLRDFFDKFPAEAIGGSNRDSAAACEIIVEWGGTSPVQTDLDGTKKFFRKRGWIRAFFEANAVVPGSIVSVEQLEYLRYRVRVVKN